MIHAGDYDDYYVPALFEPWARDLLRRALVWKGDRAIDLACGTGIVACRIAGSGPRVIGVDRSVERLERAAARARDETVAVTWRNADFAATGLPAASADLVTCHQGLQFADDRAAVTREARRLLASGGRALFACWAEIPIGFAAVDAAATAHLGGGDPQPFGFTEDEMRAHLTSARFMAIQVETAQRLVRFSEPQRFVDTAVRSIAEDRGATDEAAIAAAIGEATAALAPAIVDGRLEMPTRAVIGIGRVSAR